MEERPSPEKNESGSRREGGDDPVTFDHDRLSQTPKESQKRLFQSRRRQAKRQRRSERRRKKLQVVLIPLIFVAVFVVFGVATLRNWHRANKEAEEKLAREAESRERREQAVNPAPAEPSELEEARKRFLLRESSDAASADPASPDPAKTPAEPSEQ